MQQFSELLQTLRDTSGTNSKKTVLANFKNHQDELKYCLNPFMKFNVTSKAVSPDYGEQDLNWSKAKKLLDSLHLRELTGNAAINAIEDLLCKVEKNQAETFLCFLDKDLRAGTGISLVNKVFKKLIPTFDVQLCKKYEDLETLPFKNTYCSRKLDGVRVLAIRKSGNWNFYSRKGNEFLTLEVLRQDLLKYLKNDMLMDVVLDGEVCLKTIDGTDDFTGIVSEIKRKDHTIENPMFHIFDMMPLSDFENRTSIFDFEERLQIMTESFEDFEAKCFRVLPQFVLESAKQLIEESDKASTLGWEGLILKDGDSLYEGKRVKTMLKVKKFYEHEFEVTGSYEGEGEFVGTLGGLNLKGTITEINPKWEGFEIVSDVGSGFKVDQRAELWSDQESLIGKIVTIKFFEVSQDKTGRHSLRFPTFKFFHGEKRTM